MEVTLDRLEHFAKEFVHSLPSNHGEKAYVVGLQGDLGAGKTTFVQAVAQVLGVKSRVTSPTFVIAQRYDTAHPVFTHLVHVDAYRLSDETGDTIGFMDYVRDPHTLVLVEWPEHLPVEFPKDAPILKFETLDKNTRRIT